MQGVQLKKHIDSTLGSGNLRDAVRLPPGEDLNEWLAVNSKFCIPHMLRGKGVPCNCVQCTDHISVDSSQLLISSIR
jgi:hypothetical protein